ncbi:YhdP family protein [Legionella londiniensis]|uniref:Transmembrane protein n=1 Tax=Legionella londiniensis TaxID=45068 RepID=A0A0W0VNG5_9GAMM|nr:YhdP family protein [Legionella londiniensis]KTD21712.1 transmembrane protein [Legionella londiniensis]STX93452.1 transmembrane protein [Legionella londiniensis]
MSNQKSQISQSDHEAILSTDNTSSKQEKKQVSFVRRWLKKTGLFLAVAFIFAAIVFSLFRALTPLAAQYKSEIEEHLSNLIGQPVRINRIETSWYWFEPVLKLEQVQVLDARNHAIQLSTLLIGINLLSSIWHWHIQPGVLYIDDLHLILHQKKDSWQIEGLDQNREMRFAEAEYRALLGWLMLQHKIIAKNISATVYLEDGSLLPVKDIRLSVLNRSGHYHVKARANLSQTPETDLTFLADLNSHDLNQTNGQAYLALKDINPQQWQALLPYKKYLFQGGRGNISLWFDFVDSSLKNCQAILDFRNLSLKKQDGNRTHFAQMLKANLALTPTLEGWELAGDHIELGLEGKKWPQNQIWVEYQRAAEAYRIYVKSLYLEPLLFANIDWPEKIKPVIAAKPEGVLNNLQLLIKQGELHYFLSQFKNISWMATRDVPGMSNLSGVLHWQPKEGHLELDSRNATLTPKSLPPIKFKNIQGVLDWKALSHGMRISLDHVLLVNPDLTISARGVWDKAFTDDGGNIRLVAKYSADNAAKWLAYLPRDYLKPKLYTWLKNNIHRIEKASGQLKVDGPIADFPFDKQPGEFHFSNYLSGLDLTFKEKWPLTQNVNVNLYFNKRNLEADVHYAELDDMIVKQVNLRIDDLGLDHETLLLHGKTKTQADKLLRYVKHSPLNDRLAKLNMLKMDGDVDLELRLEIPLYPENDAIFASGRVDFNENKVVADYAMQQLELNQLKGSLLFDEQGITHSDLGASLLGDPVVMSIHSVRSNKPYTEVNISGHTATELLQKKFDLPMLSFMQGSIQFIARMTLTDDPHDLDHIHISTPLTGVAIDLPSPFGKTSQQISPLDIEIDFNPQTAVRLYVNFDDTISAKLWFKRQGQQFLLHKGMVRIGSGYVSEPRQRGISLVGTLPSLNWQNWQSVLAKFPDGSSSSGLFEKIRYIDIKLAQFIFGKLVYQNFIFKARKQTKDQWSLDLVHRDILAKLQYNPVNNHLSGEVSHLSIPKKDWGEEYAASSASNYLPGQIPNLDINIKELKLGDIDLGRLSLQGKNKKTIWQLTRFLLESPFYQLNLEGEWRRNDKENRTDIQGRLYMNDLAQSLSRWHVSPVVEAHYGQVFIHSSWPGAFSDFSLAKIKGHITMTFKEGRISNLSPETEEKLGLGKLLSILSLQTIPRRLKLDFSDLANDGYSFDVFKGGFILKDGVMSTTDTYIDGPVAYAGIKGDLDLARKLYDLELRVSPHITASLPVVATIAGGPVAGIATWIASKLISHSMQKISGYTYKITGPWLKPVVQQVSIIKS